MGRPIGLQVASIAVSSLMATDVRWRSHTAKKRFNKFCDAMFRLSQAFISLFTIC